LDAAGLLLTELTGLVLEQLAMIAMTDMAVIRFLIMGFFLSFRVCSITLPGPLPDPQKYTLLLLKNIIYQRNFIF
jgi:hypothetical protein